MRRALLPMQILRTEGSSKEEVFMAQGLPSVFQIVIALVVLAILVWPADEVNRTDLGQEGSDHVDVP